MVHRPETANIALSNNSDEDIESNDFNPASAKVKRNVRLCDMTIYMQAQSAAYCFRYPTIRAAGSVAVLTFLCETAYTDFLDSVAH